MTVGELSRRMSSHELLEWAVMYKLELEARQAAELDANLEARHAQRTR